MSKVTKVIVEIETTNDSFEEDFKFELEHVLGKVAAIDEQKLRDYNGNVVGSVRVVTE